MPEQHSIIPLSGRMGDRVFYHKKDKKGRKKYYVRRAPETVRQTTATKRTATDFGSASKASRLIRHALKPYTCQFSDESLHYRLNTQLLQVLRLDTEQPAGQKRLLPHNMSLLTGFRFNNDTRVPESDQVEINGNREIKISGGNTDMKARVIALSVNFQQESTNLRVGEDIMIKKDTKQTIITPERNTRDLTLLLLEIQTGGNKHSLNIIGILQPATMASHTKIRTKLQVQPRSMVNTCIHHPYTYLYQGKKRLITARSAPGRSPFPVLSAPPTPSNDLSPSNQDR